MNEIDRDLQSRLKQLADEVEPDARRERVVMDLVRTKRRLVAVGSGLMCLLLVGGLAGASMLWQPEESTPAPPGPSDCGKPLYDVAVFIDDSTTADEVETLRDRLLSDRDVREVTYVSKLAAFQEFKDQYADRPEFYENLPEDALPASFRVTLVERADPDEAAKRFQELPKVKDVRTAESLERSRPSPGSDSAPRCGEQPDPSTMTVTELAAVLFLGPELIDAVPAGFSVDQIVRNGPEETNHDYATVGVRMNEPVDYARVIFFVHPDDAAANDMYEKELSKALASFRAARQSHDFRGWRPYAVANAARGTKCSAGNQNLFTCFALRGRVVMLTQSTAGGTRLGGKVSEAQLEAAESLARTFSSYLNRIYPSQKAQPESIREGLRISATPENRRVAAGEQVDFTVRVRVPKGPVTLASGADWDDASRGTGLGGQTDGCPSPAPLPTVVRWTWKTRIFDHVYREAGRYRPTFEIYVESCLYSTSLRDTVTVLVEY